MDEVSETPSSASVSSEVPLGIGNDSSQRTDFIASLRKPGRRTVRKRKAQEDSEGEGEGGGSESERYRVLAREAVWCAFLFGACEKKLVGAAIRRAWGASANADEAPYQEARGNFQDHVKRHKYATLEAMEAWITSEMEVPGVRAKLTETSHRGRVLHFEAQFSIVNFFQVFGFLAGYLNFDKTAPLGKWYCKYLFANLATETVAYVLANEAFVGQLTRSEVDQQIDPSLRDSPAPAAAIPSVAAAAAAVGKKRPIDRNARQILLDAWVALPTADHCKLVSRTLFKEEVDTTSGTKRKRQARDLSAAERACTSAPPPPPSLPLE